MKTSENYVTKRYVQSVLCFAKRYIPPKVAAAFFRNALLVLKVVINHVGIERFRFLGFPDGSFDVHVVPRQNDVCRTPCQPL